MICPSCQIPKVIYFVGFNRADQRKLRSGFEAEIGHDCDDPDCTLNGLIVRIRFTKKPREAATDVCNKTVSFTINKKDMQQMHDLFLQSDIHEHLTVCLFCERTDEGLKSRISHMMQSQGMASFHRPDLYN